MKLYIQHKKTYRYSESIQLLPHIIKLKPKNTINQTVQNFKLNIVPRPHVIDTRLDIDDSIIQYIYFEKKCSIILYQYNDYFETSGYNLVILMITFVNF